MQLGLLLKAGTCMGGLTYTRCHKKINVISRGVILLIARVIVLKVSVPVLKNQFSKYPRNSIFFDTLSDLECYKLASVSASPIISTSVKTYQRPKDFHQENKGTSKTTGGVY